MGFVCETLVCWAPITLGNRTTLGLLSHTTPDLHTLQIYIARILTVFLFEHIYLSPVFSVLRWCKGKLLSYNKAFFPNHFKVLQFRPANTRVCVFYIMFHKSSLSFYSKEIQKIPIRWNTLKPFRPNTFHCCQQTPPKDRERFDNVYNRHPKAAEHHQMLRQDGARRRPEGEMRSGTRSGFWTLKATKSQQRFWYTCRLLRYWTPTGALGREPLTRNGQRGPERLNV